MDIHFTSATLDNRSVTDDAAKMGSAAAVSVWMGRAFGMAVLLESNNQLYATSGDLAGIGRHGQVEALLIGMSYCPLVRGNFPLGADVIGSPLRRLAAGLREQHERIQRHGDDARIVDGRPVRPRDEQSERSTFGRFFDERPDAPCVTHGVNASPVVDPHGDLLVADL